MNSREIAKLVGGELSGNGDAEINSVADLESAHRDQLAFVDDERKFERSAAGCLLVRPDFETDVNCDVIRVKDPKLAFAVAAKSLHPYRWRSGYHESAVIAEDSDVRASFVGAFVSIESGTHIGEGSEIHDGSRVGRGVSIGKCTIIHANVTIYDNVTIGDNCVIHSGAVIGADGFGYVRGPEGYVQFPQIGTVVIEDNVEIGAATCVDRGALGETRIGEGTKIDNLVQVAHNVQIGKRVVIAAQTGISGSTVIEDDCVIGGQVGMGDHARVMSGAVIGSQAGVLPGKIVRPGVWWGTPIQPLDEYKRQNAMVKGIGRLKDEIREIKHRVDKLGSETE